MNNLSRYPIVRAKFSYFRRFHRHSFVAGFVAILLCFLQTGSSYVTAKTVRLLTVGNSFADNALTYLPQLAEAFGNSLIFARANLGGSTLERHWNHAEKHEADPNDKEGSPYANGKFSLAELLIKDRWDFVIIQQVSVQSHDIDTYYPYAKKTLPIHPPASTSIGDSCAPDLGLPGR